MAPISTAPLCLSTGFDWGPLRMALRGHQEDLTIAGPGSWLGLADDLDAFIAGAEPAGALQALLQQRLEILVHRDARWTGVLRQITLGRLHTRNHCCISDIRIPQAASDLEQGVRYLFAFVERAGGLLELRVAQLFQYGGGQALLLLEPDGRVVLPVEQLILPGEHLQAAGQLTLEAGGRLLLAGDDPAYPSDADGIIPWCVWGMTPVRTMGAGLVALRAFLDAHWLGSFHYQIEPSRSELSAAESPLSELTLSDLIKALEEARQGYRLSSAYGLSSSWVHRWRAGSLLTDYLTRSGVPARLIFHRNELDRQHSTCFVQIVPPAEPLGPNEPWLLREARYYAAEGFRVVFDTADSRGDAMAKNLMGHAICLPWADIDSLVPSPGARHELEHADHFIARQRALQRHAALTGDRKGLLPDIWLAGDQLEFLRDILSGIDLNPGYGGSKGHHLDEITCYLVGARENLLSAQHAWQQLQQNDSTLFWTLALSHLEDLASDTEAIAQFLATDGPIIGEAIAALQGPNPRLARSWIGGIGPVVVIPLSGISLFISEAQLRGGRVDDSYVWLLPPIKRVLENARRYLLDARISLNNLYDHAERIREQLGVVPI